MAAKSKKKQKRARAVSAKKEKNLKMKNKTLNGIVVLIAAVILAAGVCCVGFASRGEDDKWFRNSNLSTWHWSDKSGDEAENTPGGEMLDDSDEKEPNTPDGETSDERNEEEPKMPEAGMPNFEQLFESMYAKLDGLVGDLGQ